MRDDVSAFILAGGKSTRMGSDKAFVTLNGRTLLSHALERARSLTPNVWIVGDPQKYESHGTVVPDIFVDCGPLAGIHSALGASSTELNLVLAVDVPFASLALLQFLIERAKRNPGVCVTVPRTNAGWQPLCAVYHRSFAPAAEEALRGGRFRIDRLFAVVPTDGISEEELRQAGFTREMFRNLNTPEDLAAAQ